MNTDSQEVLAEHALQQTLFDTAEQKAEEQADTGGSDFSDADLKKQAGVETFIKTGKTASSYHRTIV